MPEQTTVDLVNPKTDEDFFAIGRILLSRSTCLKTQTAALIVVNGEVISWGVNMCCPQGQVYGLPVAECPRKSAETGTHYELCKPIHAEIVAAINAFGIGHVERKSLWHFPGFTLKLKYYEGFFKNKNSVLYLLGHYWACQECVDFLKLIGITEIKFDDLSGGKTLKSYRAQDLTGKDHALDISGCIVNGIVTVKIESKEIGAFCARQGLKENEVSAFLLGDGDLYIVRVPAGKEKASADRFGKDSAVQGAGLLLARSI